MPLPKKAKQNRALLFELSEWLLNAVGEADEAYDDSEESEWENLEFTLLFEHTTAEAMAAYRAEYLTHLHERKISTPWKFERVPSLTLEASARIHAAELLAIGVCEIHHDASGGCYVVTRPVPTLVLSDVESAYLHALATGGVSAGALLSSLLAHFAAATERNGQELFRKEVWKTALRGGDIESLSPLSRDRAESFFQVPVAPPVHNYRVYTSQVNADYFDVQAESEERARELATTQWLNQNARRASVPVSGVERQPDTVPAK